MATGYTSIIEEGATFEQFAIRCAHAFGACITLRDDGLDARMPEKFEPSDYHVKAAGEASKRLEELKKMSRDDIRRAIDDEYNNKLARNEKYKAKNDGLETKYKSMLRQISAWQPPTREHNELKAFMVDQVEKSLRFDCRPREYKPPIKPDMDAWMEENIKAAKKDVEYHNKEYKEELERVDGRNRWIKELRDSLNKPLDK